MKENSLNKNYWCRMEIVSPVHIGVGGECDLTRGIDFIEVQRTIYYIDLPALIAGKGEKVLTFLQNRELDKLFSEKENLSSFCTAQYELPCKSETIKPFIEEALGGKPIVPGSSLKGAIRSHILNYLHSKGFQVKEKNVFGSLKEGEDMMRFFKISDCEFENRTVLNTKLFNLRQENGKFTGGWKHAAHSTDQTYKMGGFNTLYEMLIPGDSALCRIGIDAQVARQVVSQGGHIEREKMSVIEGGINRLFELINSQTREYLLKEQAFFSKYSTDRTPEIEEQLDALLNRLEQAEKSGQEALLRVGAGCGFHSITGDWIHNEHHDINNITNRRGAYNDKNSAKSRKIVNYNNKLGLMGFVSLHALSDDAVKRMLDEREQAERARMEERQHAEQERQRLENEHRKRELEKQRQCEKFKTLLNSVNDCEESREELLKALELLSQAEAIFDGDKQVKDLRDKITKKLQMLDNIASAEEFIAKEQQERRTANAVPLAEKISSEKKIPTALGKVKSWMRDNGLTALSAADEQVLKETLTAIYVSMTPRDQKAANSIQKWTDLTQIVGNDTMKLWFYEITVK